MHLSRCFIHCSKQFWVCRFWCFLVASAVFCFICSTLAKCFPSRTFFIQRNNKQKCCSGRHWVNREGGAQRSTFFGQKLLNTQHCGQVHSQITHHEMGKYIEGVFKKNSWKPSAASHNNASWYTDTDGSLEHSLFFLGGGGWDALSYKSCKFRLFAWYLILYLEGNQGLIEIQAANYIIKNDWVLSH